MAAPRQPAEQARRSGVKEGAARTLAQTACLALGATLIAAGILGFFFGGNDFNTGSGVQGEEFIVFAVNGWHNIVHLASGAFLVLMAPKAKSAVTGLLVFGIVYVVVVVWGFIDGNDIANLLPINTADNWLHVALAVVALAVAVSAGGLARSASSDARRA